jgi:ABC-type dipeptide/oligopeptide/nickel transport system ATPase subunit
MVSDDDIYNAMVQCDCVSLLDKYQLHYEIITRATMNLSGGEKQRLLLVRAILSDPLFLILDEPKSQMDQTGTDAFFFIGIEWQKNVGFFFLENEK